MLNGYDEMMAFGKGNVEAVVQSGTVAVKGMEELGKLYTDYTNLSIAKANEAVKALSSCKTPQEFMQLQTKLTRDGIESFISDSRKLAEITAGVVNKSIEPLAARFQAVSSLKMAA
ncbi:MAG: phasin family protein [Alphaproteobacteria bacterium]|nr:phasin family protein [Alphaproteobacteria bacterium]